MRINDGEDNETSTCGRRCCTKRLRNIAGKRIQVHLQEMNVKELLQLQTSITTELKARGVVRTQNNPLGDYTEWLIAKALGLELQANSKAGYDGIRDNGVRVQIKGRRVTPTNNSRQLSAIRKYQERDFDELAAVIFDVNFNVIEALLIPHEVVGKYASYRSHVNAHILTLKGPVLIDPRVQCIKQQINAALQFASEHGVAQPEEVMSHKEKLHVLFDEMADELAAFIDESQSGFSDDWVPAAYIKDQLQLKKSAYPQGNKIDNETGWLFSTLARHLQDKGKVDYKKIGNRSFYKCK